jgi:hypothetical protein
MQILDFHQELLYIRIILQILLRGLGWGVLFRRPFALNQHHLESRGAVVHVVTAR